MREEGRNDNEVKLAQGFNFGIVVGRFNEDITVRLLAAATETLQNAGAPIESIEVIRVPGAFEIPLAAHLLAEQGRVDGVLCLGCVIRGETAHYEHICRTVADGIASLNLEHGIPFTFGVITAETRDQAEDRSGGKHGNLGKEWAETLIEMVNLLEGLSAGKLELN